ncbi:unnamed protein product [Strongylus vulgaris]|uniref:Uncharacterized protein n=1 Tax=Strongylus vulgaris TaxID=40348 RepID=A0A3P7IJW8_STRVU|nr:unnamed protein product [Strongylus vulgaris]
MPNSFRYEATPTASTYLTQPPPHSFPLQSSQGQRAEGKQWRIPQPYTAQAPQITSYQREQEVDYNSGGQSSIPIGQQQPQMHFQFQQTQFQPYKPRQLPVHVPLGIYTQAQASLITQSQHDYGQQTQHQPLLMEEASHQAQAGFTSQERRPDELMEAEMKAMRYVYLMNEQRHARKALAERDEKMSKKSEPGIIDLMLLSELPPIVIEPTVIPEGVPRYRMQEHILPPYHHAQFAVRNGPLVSPYRSEGEDESSEDEIHKLRDVLDLTSLEPPVPQQKATSDLHSVHKPQFQSQSIVEKNQRQQYPSGGSHKSLRFPAAELLQEPTQVPSMASELSIPQKLQPLEIDISKTGDVTMLSRGSTPASQGDSELSGEKVNRRREDEASQRDSSPESTDSDAIRRQWDLSPSVSPLTLEALASGLSSPDGSDSNDGQTGMPVWPTISRKHAKLAIAACRNMPKRLQPLCRRFAWQQGITYLLENFCLKKWEIRPEHDSESVWFFERNVRRFKPFELEPWEIPGGDTEDENDFYGFNICADVPVKKCSKTIRLEDFATVSFSCQESPGIVEYSSTDDEGYSDEKTEYASSVYYDVDDIAPS